MQENDAPWTFARFAPGQSFGAVEVALDETRRADWARVYGAPGARPPRGLIVAAMMEAYIRAIQPRPKGNVHAAQTLEFTGAAPGWGDRVEFAVSCAGKEEKKGRFWVDFGIEASVNGAPAMRGVIRSIWAA